MTVLQSQSEGREKMSMNHPTSMFKLVNLSQPYGLDQGVAGSLGKGPPGFVLAVLSVGLHLERSRNPLDLLGAWRERAGGSRQLERSPQQAFKIYMHIYIHKYMYTCVYSNNMCLYVCKHITQTCIQKYVSMYYIYNKYIYIYVYIYISGTGHLFRKPNCMFEASVKELNMQINRSTGVT